MGQRAAAGGNLIDHRGQSARLLSAREYAMGASLCQGFLAKESDQRFCMLHLATLGYTWLTHLELGNRFGNGRLDLAGGRPAGWSAGGGLWALWIRGAAHWRRWRLWRRCRLSARRRPRSRLTGWSPGCRCLIPARGTAQTRSLLAAGWLGLHLTAGLWSRAPVPGAGVVPLLRVGRELGPQVRRVPASSVHQRAGSLRRSRAGGSRSSTVGPAGCGRQRQGPPPRRDGPLAHQPGGAGAKSRPVPEGAAWTGPGLAPLFAS